MKKKILAVLLVIVLIFALMSAVQARSPQETLKQYISDLQKNPDDNALREKIIKLVQTMKPKPAIPDDAVTHEGAAEYAFKSAKTEADFADAAKEYEKALLAAPWVAVDYFNCGIAYENAKQFDAAIRNFNLYLVAAPDAPDANAVRKRIGGLNYAKEKAAKESIPAAIAEKKKSTTPTEIKRDGRFIAYNNGTVLDTWTNLMWAAHDNGSNINWETAKAYCENYRVGGYSDWRMPTLNELTGLYDSNKNIRTQYAYVHLTELILLPTVSIWSSDTRGSDALTFNFSRGDWFGFRLVSDNLAGGALPVRSGK